MLRRIPLWLLGVCGAALVTMVQLPFWVLFVARRVAYAYPIDYGEGPLLRQLQFVLHGGSLAGVYGDLQAEPFVVANYPPLFLSVSRLFALVVPALTAGRVVSALAGLTAGVAIWLLAQALRNRLRSVWLASALTAAVWYAIPIVREWSGVMRVDMLGVALGLLGLVLAQRGRVTMGSVLVALALLAKPTLIAAPLSLLVLLVTVPRRAALRAILVAAGSLVLVVAVFTLAGAQLWLHVVRANVNGWEYALARGFWKELLTIHWPLFVVALAAAVLLARRWRSALTAEFLPLTMALAYCFGGVVVGVGIGKVGAYANYFLELYAGLIWLATRLVVWFGAQENRARWGAVAVVALCNLAVLRFYPLWSDVYPKPYGMIEQQRPARVVVGSYGVWQDYRREGQILAANAVTNADLTSAIRAAGDAVYTDVPAIAAQADVRAPMQVFEHRQLLDAGLWDQKPLLRQLANGQIPIVVLDYLGNWMTPESIALITTRYAQSGSRGSFDIYQPLATGAPRPVEAAFGSLVIDRVAIPAPLLQPAYEPGSTLPVLLRVSGSGSTAAQQVTLLLRDAQGGVVARSTQPLFAGALSAADLAAGPLEHLQALSIPRRVATGNYTLVVSVDDAAALDLTTVPVAAAGGVMRGEPAILVPAAVQAYISGHGGEAAYGVPQMPALPFADMTLQCFTKRCVLLPAGSTTVQDAPLGEWLRGATALLQPAGADDTSHFERVIAQSGTYDGPAHAAADQARRDGATTLWLRRDVLLTFDGESVHVGDGGARVLRLPGIPYRWGGDR